MGSDFSALLRYDGPGTVISEAISRLERYDAFPTLEAVTRHARAEGYRSLAEPLDAVPVWRYRLNWDVNVILPLRPSLPDLSVELDLPSGFALVFGADAVQIYSLLRWATFLTDKTWRPPVLDAVHTFCDLFGASECIVTRDEHPAILSFLDGAPFLEAMRLASQQDEGEVTSLDDLFIDDGVADDLLSEGPDGDETIPIGDSRGYWRLPLSASVRPLD